MGWGKANVLSHCNGFIKTEIFRLKLVIKKKTLGLNKVIYLIKS